MEKKFKMIVNGQALQQQDVNQVASEAALADDHILWELMKMKTFTGGAAQKAVVPAGTFDWSAPYSLTSTALVQGNTADAKVRIMPFRAFVSSQDNTSKLEELRGQRSGYGISNVTGYTDLTLAANASGNPRWDLIKAAVVINASDAASTRYVKDPASLVVSPQAISIYNSVTVTLSVTQGTPAASPTYPALPADSAGTYYIPLAYVRVPNGFNASSIVQKQAIHEVAPTLPIHSTTGVMNLRPANSLNKIPGVVNTNQSGSTSSFRPGAYLPSTMVGGESRIILLQLGLAPKSHLDGEVVDDSIDWRFRFFRSTVFVQGPDLSPGSTTSAGGFASDRQATGFFRVPSVNFTGNKVITRMGQSMYNDTENFSFGDVTANGQALYVADSDVDLSAGAGQAFALVIDSQGRLIVRYTVAVAAQILIWLDATAPYSNYGSV